MTTAYSIGQIVPGNRALPIIEPGAAAWFGLRSQPQKEANLRAWLDQRGIRAFYPVTMARRRLPRGAKRWCDYEKRYLPGYVFVEMPGRVIWSRLFDQCRYVRDVIRYASDGRPAPLDWGDLQRLHDMRNVDADRAQRQRVARQIRVGDRVSFDLGGVPVERVEVVDLRAGSAVVRIGLLGAAPVSVPLGQVTKTQGVA